jgi:UDP-N-acetyl-D-galactosamine dehydrogenase
MRVFNDLVNKKAKLALVGLGYVGMPIAVAFDKKGLNVVGFDINQEKIKEYKNGIDPTNEVGNEGISLAKIEFTSDESKLTEANFIIVSVPTPITYDNIPDLTPVESASVIVGRNLQRGAIVVFESTVYPGVTENICVPIIEKESNLVCGEDFFVGYSPERINPGDKVHTLATIKKIVSGQDKTTLDEIARVYGLVIDAGVYRAQSIKVAEAAKVIENSQRDVNIAFMNEVAMALKTMQIDTQDVINAMNTKWNALGFKPGLVGGHCIGVDPYYFIHEAERLGYHSQILAPARQLNNDMGKYIAVSIVKELVRQKKSIQKLQIAILGFSFKENCPDIRNTKIIDIINELKEYGINPIVVDPRANVKEVKEHYGIEISDIREIKELDCIVLAVAHKEFLSISLDSFVKMYKKELDAKQRFIFDIKSVLDKEQALDKGLVVWRL